MPHRRLDVIGRVFDRLTVLEPVQPIKGVFMWRCRCACGNETLARSFALVSGHKTSCGCKHSESKPKTPAGRESIRQSKLGPKNHNWKGENAQPNSGRERARYLYAQRPCESCGAEKTERHHIDGNTCNNEPDNIALLCRRCHMRADGRLARLVAMAAYAAKGKLRGR